MEDLVSSDGMQRPLLDKIHLATGKLNKKKRHLISPSEIQEKLDENYDSDDGKAPPISVIALPSSSNDAEMSLPLLLRNAKPKGIEPAFDKEQFKKVNVEDFGEAMLRGMGWSKDQGNQPGSAENNLSFNEPVEFRPALLGLGALPKNMSKKKTKKSKLESPTQLDRDHRAGKLIDNSIIEVSHGRFKSRLGVVKQSNGVPGLNNIVVVLDPGKESKVLSKLPEVVIRRENIIVIGTESDFPPDHPGNKLLKAFKAQCKAEESRERDMNSRHLKNKKLEFSSKDINPVKQNDNANIDRSEMRTRFDDSKKRIKRKEDCWLMPGITVRIMSRSLEKGKFYSQKAIVVDILDPQKPSCLLSVRGHGRDVTLEGVTQSQLDTALPKKGGPVVIVRGSLQGMKGILLNRSASRDEAIVQLDSDMRIERMGLDDVAEYVGI